MDTTIDVTPQVGLGGLWSVGAASDDPQPAMAPEAPGFQDSLSHLLAELERLDFLIESQVARARAHALRRDDLQGLCITEAEVDALLERPCGLPRWAERSPSDSRSDERWHAFREEIDRRRRVSEARGVRLRLDELTALFGLSELDVEILMVCLAPEMDLKYERLYAYLHDDVTKKRPSVDLILNLLSPGFVDKVDGRRRFAAEAPLVRHQLLQLFVDPSQPEPGWLRKYARIDPRILGFLLEQDELDDRLRPVATLLGPGDPDETGSLAPAVMERLAVFARHAQAHGEPVVWYFQGLRGTGKQASAQALSRQTGAVLLCVDLIQLLESASPGFVAGIDLALREARLRRGWTYWRSFDVLLTPERTAELDGFLGRLAAQPGLSILAGQTVWEPAERQLPGVRFHRIEFHDLSHENRRARWEAVVPPQDRGATVDFGTLSSQFRLNAGAIFAAAATARNLARWREPQGGRVTAEDLQTACRLQSNRNLATLARRVEAKHALTDIVLPPDQLGQLTEMLNQARYRQVVLGDWGFGRKLSMGKGLNALFSGPPGTGKTMAAQVIARELGLDLYQIDLSQMVSKYIGETEKNLNQIFREAHGSNAILFFDEADALFGKRSEVKDAHDRYANIEVGYLLQKMEEYEGVAILATNLRQNVDEAFIRRMHFIVEFPFPDAHYRRELWRHAFPREVPIGEDVDFDLLAREVRLAGGNIKNIALAAAFYAAADGRVIRMPHMAHAVGREYQKMGQDWKDVVSVSRTAISPE